MVASTIRRRLGKRVSHCDTLGKPRIFYPFGFRTSGDRNLSQSILIDFRFFPTFSPAQIVIICTHLAIFTLALSAQNDEDVKRDFSLAEFDSNPFQSLLFLSFKLPEDPNK